MEVIMETEECKTVDSSEERFCLMCKASIPKSNRSDTIFRIYCDVCFNILKEERCSDFIAEKKNLLIGCEICSDSYIYSRQLRFHYCTRDNIYNCHDCGQQLERKKSMIEHARIVHQDKYWGSYIRCYICWKCFSTWSNYDSHMISHSVEHFQACWESNLLTDKKVFFCSCCNKSFRNNYSLKRHIRIHTGERPYKCTTCDKSFIRKHHLEIHMNTHTGEKPHKCSACDKGFSRKHHLATHMTIHVGKSSTQTGKYKCNLCDKTFSRNSNLLGHIRTHTGERPFECTTCNKNFFFKYHLVEHMRTHSGERPYKCTTCDKDFSRKQHLEVHMVIHSGEKPYSCTICGKNFSRKHHLETHTKSHSRERPYKCTSCDKTFSVKTTLDRHMRVHVEKV